MITADLKTLELNEFIAKDNSQQHCKANFPLLGAHGTSSSATVYFELEPGDNLGRHTDSAEELLLILEGRVEVSLDCESDKLDAGSLAVVPRMVPHDIRNIGGTRAKVLGFFGGANHIVATFEKGWLPEGNQVVDTAAVFEEVKM